MMTNRPLAGLLLVVLILPGSRAQADRSLTIDEAIAMARKSNRDLLAAKTNLDIAQAGVEQAWAALLPQVVTQGKYTHNYKEVVLDVTQFNQSTVQLADIIRQASAEATLKERVAAFESGLQAIAAATAPVVIQKEEQLDAAASATVPLIVPWAYGSLKAAKLQKSATAANIRVTEATLLLSTAQAFYAAAGSDELVVARHHAIDVARQTLENAKARLAAGVVNRVEVMRAELSLVQAEQAALEAADSQAQAYRSLATIIQLHDPFRVVAPEEPGAEASADQLVREALTLRPEFVSYQKNIRADSATISSARWRWAPVLSAFGNARIFNYTGFSGDHFAWAVGLQLDWTIYDGGLRDAQAHQAIAQRKGDQLKYEQLRDTVADEVRNARQAVDTKRKALEAARRSVDLSRETLGLVRVQHDAGTATQLDLLEAQDSLVAAEVGVAQARFDLGLADVTLRRSAGLFPEQF
jgi:outer membrane protein TolC